MDRIAVKPESADMYGGRPNDDDELVVSMSSAD